MLIVLHPTKESDVGQKLKKKNCLKQLLKEGKINLDEIPRVTILRIFYLGDALLTTISRVSQLYK